MAKRQYKGSLLTPGGRPQTVELVVDRVPQLTKAEANAGIQWVDDRYEPGVVLRYGPNTTPGTTNMTAAIQAAVDTGHDVVFPSGTYFLGTANSGAFISANNSGQRFIFEEGAKLVANGNDGVTNTASIIEIDSVSDITLYNPSFESNWGVDIDRDSPYAIGILCSTASAENITIIQPKARLCQAMVQITKADFDTAYEVENIDIVNGLADECHRGLVCTMTGNRLRASYKAINATRSYFISGCHSHDVQVMDVSDGISSGLLHSPHIQALSHNGSIAAKDVYDIRLKMKMVDTTYSGIPFQFQVTHTTGDAKLGVIYDIDLTYDDHSTSSGNSIGFAYTLDGTTQTSYTGTCWDRITIKGYAKNPFNLTNAGAIGSPVAQTVPGILNIGQLEMDAAPTGTNNPHRTTLFTGGTVFNDARNLNFTPVVAGSSAAGTATYTTQQGVARKRGTTVSFDISLVYTGHTGTGNLLITGLPFTSKNQSGYISVCNVMSASLTFSNQLTGYISSNVTQINLATQASGSALADLAIDAAATIYVSGTYETN